jgi:hypothetical protein
MSLLLPLQLLLTSWHLCVSSTLRLPRLTAAASHTSRPLSLFR